MQTNPKSSPIPPLPEERRERFVLRFGLRALLAAMVFASVGAYWGAGWRRDQIQFAKERQVVEDLAPFGAKFKLFDRGGVRTLEFVPVDKIATNEDLQSLNRLRSAITLDLRQTHVDDEGLPALYELTGLRVLKLSPLRVSAEAATKLRERLPNTEVRPHDFFPRGSLPALNRLVSSGVLRLSGPRYDATGTQPIRVKPDAKRIFLHKNSGGARLTDRSLPDLFQVFPQMTQLSLSGARNVTDAAASVLEQHQHLDSISLTETSFSHEAARALDGAMPKTRVYWRNGSGNFFNGSQ